MREEKNKNRLLSAYSWAESIIFALGLVMLIFTFAIKGYRVDGESMVPTLESGQRVVALDLFYDPKPQDIVIIDANNNYGKPLIKRVIAVGGQVVEINEEGVLCVDGVIVDTFAENVRGDIRYPLTIPEGYVFVMGDNRGSSLDSRNSRVGFIDKRSIVGHEIAVM